MEWPCRPQSLNKENLVLQQVASITSAVGSWDRGEDGIPEVTLASGPLTSFKGEVEQKIKDKKMTLGVSRWQTGQEGHGKEATAQNCSPGKANVW